LELRNFQLIYNIRYLYERAEDYLELF